MSYYTDRLSEFRLNNSKEGHRKQGLTQLSRALKEIGVDLICAYSPQVGTLQDWIVKELRLREISTIEEANKYLGEYIEEHNALFSINAAKEEDTHRLMQEDELERAFCYKEERMLTKNLEISYERRIFQIEEEQSGICDERCKGDSDRKAGRRPE